MFVGHPMLASPWNTFPWRLCGPPRHAGPYIWPDPFKAMVRVCNEAARAAWVAAARFPMAVGKGLEAADRPHPGTQSAMVDTVPGGLH